ncbi:MAG: dipeptidase [Treponema sp.]|nr:dipeptidase [Treponema sp.]
MAHTVIDLHCDSVATLVKGKDLRQTVQGVHVDLPRLKAGGVGLQVFAAYVSSYTDYDKAFRLANEKLDLIQAFAASDEQLTLVETAADTRAAMTAGKTGIMLSVENGLTIEDSLDKLAAFRRRKVRIMTLVHFRHLPWAASSNDTRPFAPEGGSRGLSRFGEQVIDAMNELGIIPDLSHASESTFWDVVRRSKKPVIASHSCAHRLCAVSRNLKDDQLKALGDSGGLVGVNFFSLFLSEAFRLSYEENEHSATAAAASVPVPMSTIADHIDYMVNIAGEDCIALGSDFDGIPAAPEGVGGSDFYPFLEAELRNRGHSESRIGKIFNGNFLRVLEQWG